MQFIGETTGQSGIHHQELLHLVLIAGSYHHKFTTIVLHTLHQCVDSFLTILVTTVTESIGLIDEEDTTHRLVTHAVDNLGSLTHVFAD